MIDPANVPAVQAGELLARYVFSSSHVRADKTVKPDALQPHPHTDMSVTRHLQATAQEVWEAGKVVGRQREKILHGRLDISLEACTSNGLVVTPDPVEGNPNHANVGGWPEADKARQKSIAQTILAALGTVYIEVPPA